MWSPDAAKTGVAPFCHYDLSRSIGFLSDFAIRSSSLWRFQLSAVRLASSVSKRDHAAYCS